MWIHIFKLDRLSSHAKSFYSLLQRYGTINKRNVLVEVYIIIRLRTQWRPILFYIFDVVVHTSLLFRKIHPTRKMSSGHMKFRKYLALCLLKSQDQELISRGLLLHHFVTLDLTKSAHCKIHLSKVSNNYTSRKLFFTIPYPLLVFILNFI